MKKMIETEHRSIDWTYWLLMGLVGLGILILFGAFVLAPLMFLLSR